LSESHATSIEASWISAGPRANTLFSGSHFPLYEGPDDYVADIQQFGRLLRDRRVGTSVTRWSKPLTWLNPGAVFGTSTQFNGS
jgi:hypothetical protein